MYYYGSGYNYGGAATPYYPVYGGGYGGGYGGYGGWCGAFACVLVIFLLLVIVGCFCCRGPFLH